MSGPERCATCQEFIEPEEDALVLHDACYLPPEDKARRETAINQPIDGALLSRIVIEVYHGVPLPPAFHLKVRDTVRTLVEVAGDDNAAVLTR